MEQLLNGKVSIVTGAASGIGEATAVLYAKHGAKVVVSDVNEAAGKAVVEKIKQQGGEAIFMKTDVAQPEQCKELVAKTVEAFGRLDIACNNAGVGGEMNAIADMSVEGWNSIIAINLSSVFYCMKYEIEQMLKNGGGSIVNMASILGAVGFATSAGYVAAKHGLLGLTQNAGLEYSAQGIRTNAVGPAFINTPLLDGLDEATKGFLVQQHPIGRLGKAEEVAELVLWLSSEKSSFVTGSYYPIDGGYLAR